MARVSAFIIVLSGVLLCLISAGPGTTHGYLLNRWSARDLNLLGVSVYGSKCYPIPDNLTLCYGVGYDNMRLPNHLNHDTLAEAIDQSQIWLALTRTNCHHDLRLFLCSMYAPVCLQEPTKLKPCRSLCQSVRESCLPRMEAVGYEWPDILRCDRFPSDNQLCVPTRLNPKSACKPCRQAVTYENIISSFCMEPIVFKGRLARRQNDRRRTRLILQSKKKFFKSHGLKSHKERREVHAFIPKASGCACPTVERAQPNDKFLIMGRKVDGQVKVMFVISWQRRNRAFKKAVRAIRKKKSICKLQWRGKREGRKKRRKKKKRRGGRRGRRGRRQRGQGRRNNQRGRQRGVPRGNSTALPLPSLRPSRGP